MSKKIHARRQGSRTPPASGRKPSTRLRLSDFDYISDELVVYHHCFFHVFQRREQRHCSLFYLCGQLSDLARKTIEPMVLAFKGPDLNAVRALQQFIGQSAWETSALIIQHQALVGAWLGEAHGVIIVDGSGFPKQGEYSAGVAHQYCGHLGKVANCQEGVFLVYASSQGYTFLDSRLYLPAAWLADDFADKRQRCGIPDQITFHTEPALALQMLTEVHTRQVVPFQWVACDAHFGQNPAFLAGIAALGKWYFTEVPCDTRVWLRAPQLEPPGRGPLGRPRTHPRVKHSAPRPRELRELANTLPRQQWKRYAIKAGSKGTVQAEFAFLRVTTVRQQLPDARVWAVFRRSLDPQPELKFHLCNAPADCPPQVLAQMSGWRWPIETVLEEAKGEVGMDQYETRSWLGWHHHMAQTFLAHCFLTHIRLLLKKSPGLDRRASPSVGRQCVAGRRAIVPRYLGHHRISATPQLRRLSRTSQAHSETQDVTETIGSPEIS